MKRLFTFGCSFTNYRWSTWADCLAPEFGYFENWGQSGAGNHFIFNSVMECDQRHKFKSGDTVIVCWSDTFREDRYINKRWITLGGIRNANVYTKEFIADQADRRGFLLRDLAFIKATKALLESKVDVTWKFFSICPITLVDWLDDRLTEHTDVVEVYQDVIDSIQQPDYKTFLSKQARKAFGDDPHPTPKEHLNYLNAVLPGWVTNRETRAKIHNESINLIKDPKKSGMSKVTRL